MINISIDRPTIPEEADFTHESTSWQVSESKDFTGTLYASSIDDTENLLEFHILKTPEKDQIVFARVKINFSNDTASDWSRPITLSECQKGFKLSNTIVVTPEVLLYDAVLDISGNLKIGTTEFRLYAGTGKHLSTTWEISTMFGDIVWSRDDDEDNLLSITIPDNKLEKNKLYVVKAKHKTDTNTYSNYGRRIVSVGVLKEQGGV